MLLHLSDMNVPMTCRQWIELARSLVKDSAVIDEIRSWKEKQLHQCDELDDNNEEDCE